MLSLTGMVEERFLEEGAHWQALYAWLGLEIDTQWCLELP